MKPSSALSANCFQTTQYANGFHDWKNGKEYVTDHENSNDYRDAVISWITRRLTANRIDKAI